MDPHRLRVTLRDLESDDDDVRAAVGHVDPPDHDYPWHHLVTKAVATLLADAQAIGAACRRTHDALEDSVTDFEAVDAKVADASGGSR